MLSRSTIKHDQENGHHSSSTSSSALANPSHFPTKTPSRPTQQHRTTTTTGGKGLLTTNKGNRVLGNKDRNQSKKGTGQDGPSALLFSKPPQQSTSTNSSSCAPSTSSLLSTPAPAPTSAISHLPIHLRTPSPSGGVKRMQSLNRMNSETLELEAAAFAQVDVVQPKGAEEEVEKDREVEYAGGSSRDYDEPYIPEYDFSIISNFGTVLRSLSLVSPPSIEYQEMEEEFDKQDSDFKFVLDDEAENTKEREIESKALRTLSQEKLEPLFPTITLTKPKASSSLPANTSTNRYPFGKKPQVATGAPNATDSRSTLLSSKKPTATIPGSRSMSMGICEKSGSSTTKTTMSMMKASSTGGNSHRTLAPLLTSTQKRPVPSPKFRPSSSTTNNRPNPKPTSLRIAKFSSTSTSSATSTSSSSKSAKPKTKTAQELQEEEEKREEKLGIWGVTRGGWEEGMRGMMLGGGDEGFGMGEGEEELRGFEI